MQEPNSEQPLPPFPVMARIAGILWIILGSLLILSVPIRIVLIPAMIASRKSIGPTEVVGLCCGGFTGILAAVACIRAGIQTVRGTALGTLGNGVMSWMLGLIGIGYLAVVSSRVEELWLGLGFLITVAIFAAGSLAIFARNDYQAWRKAKDLAEEARARMHSSLEDRAPMTEGPDLLLEAERLQREGRWSEAIDRFEEICKTRGYETYRDYAKMCLTSLRKKVAAEEKQ